MPHRFTSEASEVSARMRLIRGKRTKPELLFYSQLDEAGIAYEPHVGVSGVNVDAVVDGSVLAFIDSPFWHLRDRRELTRLSPYWQGRLSRNRRRDERQVRRLRKEGFTVVRFWTDELEPKRVLRRVRAALTRARNRPQAAERGSLHG